MKTIEVLETGVSNQFISRPRVQAVFTLNGKHIGALGTNAVYYCRKDERGIDQKHVHFEQLVLTIPREEATSFLTQVGDAVNCEQNYLQLTDDDGEIFASMKTVIAASFGRVLWDEAEGKWVNLLGSNFLGL